MNSELFVEVKGPFVGTGVFDYQKEQLRYKTRHYCILDNQGGLIYTTVVPVTLVQLEEALEGKEHYEIILLEEALVEETVVAEEPIPAEENVVEKEPAVVASKKKRNKDKTEPEA